MKNKEYIRFHRYYHKLKNPDFTTVRGAGAIKEYQLNQEVYMLNGEGRLIGKALITALEQRPFSSMDLDFLKQDAEYPGFTVSRRLDFIGLLNSFRPYSKIMIDSCESSLFSLIHLRRLPTNYRWQRENEEMIYHKYDANEWRDNGTES